MSFYDLTNSHNNKGFVEDNRSHFYELEDIKYRSMGAGFMLAPLDGETLIETPDAKLLPFFANSEKINRFLPGLGFEDEKSTKKQLLGYVFKTENQLGITYVIRGQGIPIGMIFVHSPLYNKTVTNLAIWTIDFFITEAFEHKGIMRTSLIRALSELKSIIGGQTIYALVDRNNTDCINLIGKGIFQQTDNFGFRSSINGEPPLVYMFDLAKTRFERR